MMFIWELVSLGVDAAFTALFVKLYKDECRAADLVQQAKHYSLGKDLTNALTETGTLEFASTEGVAVAEGPTLTSQHGVSDAKGLIRHILYQEHKARRENGYWVDVKKNIRDQFDSVPFKLVDQTNTNGSCVTVTEPLAANRLNECLTVTFDKYTPAQSSFVNRGLDRLFGDVTKGHQDKESMLFSGTKLLAFGKFYTDGKNVLLEPPTDSFPYIITTESRREVVKSLKSRAKLFKVLAWICGAVGAGLVLYITIKGCKKLYEEYKTRKMLAELKRRRREMESEMSDTGTSGEDDARNCVICLGKPREVVLLECGHICVCADCAGALPDPKKCPICRQSVARYIATFVS